MSPGGLPGAACSAGGKAGGTAVTRVVSVLRGAVGYVGQIPAMPASPQCSLVLMPTAPLSCMSAPPPSPAPRTYGDDGVERRLRPLQDAAHALEDELAVLGELLVAADKEWYMFKKPRIFPTEQYRWGGGGLNEWVRWGGECRVQGRRWAACQRHCCRFCLLPTLRPAAPTRAGLPTRPLDPQIPPAALPFAHPPGRTLLRNCHVVLSLTQSLLYWLQSTVVNLALVRTHVQEVWHMRHALPEAGSRLCAVAASAATVGSLQVAT